MMLSNGNGNPSRCVDNLLRMVRGEVPYERLKGLDPSLIDRPSAIAEPELLTDAEWLVETYEPRAVITGVRVNASDGGQGDFAVQVNLAGSN